LDLGRGRKSGLVHIVESLVAHILHELFSVSVFVPPFTTLSEERRDKRSREEIERRVREKRRETQMSSGCQARVSRVTLLTLEM